MLPPGDLLVHVISALEAGFPSFCRPHLWTDRVVALITKHGRTSQLAAAVPSCLGCTISVRRARRQNLLGFVASGGGDGVVPGQRPQRAGGCGLQLVPLLDYDCEPQRRHRVRHHDFRDGRLAPGRLVAVLSPWRRVQHIWCRVGNTPAKAAPASRFYSRQCTGGFWHTAERGLLRGHRYHPFHWHDNCHWSRLDFPFQHGGHQHVLQQVPRDRKRHQLRGRHAGLVHLPFTAGTCTSSMGFVERCSSWVASR